MLKKPEFTPKKDIEEYLTDDFNIKVYEVFGETLTEDDENEIDPLFFLNQLYEQFETIKINKNKPLSIIKHLKALEIDRLNYFYLLNYLYELINTKNKTQNENQLNICCNFIKKETHYVEYELWPGIWEDRIKAKEREVYEFIEVKKRLEALPNTKSKIQHLIEVITEYKQNDGISLDRDTPFEKKCQLEIDKLEDILELEKQTNQKAKPAKEIKPIPWQAKNAQLVYLFQRLKDEGLLPKYNWNMNDAIQKHFLNEFGEPFKNAKQTKDGYKNNKDGKPLNHDMIDQIIKETKKQEPNKT